MKNEIVEDLEDLTLAEIVSENIHSAIVFEEYGLDFCCNGKGSLQEACAEKNIEVGKVVKSLNELSTNKNSEKYNEWAPDFLVDHIINNHHQYVRRMIPVISLHADKVASGHGKNHPETIQIADLFLAIREE
ncbi:DUF542 domain-containing protein, partial [bacterium BMS3Abin03]|nr:DUF542 domain-containing protein [bacterium BMS3Abin03]